MQVRLGREHMQGEVPLVGVECLELLASSAHPT